MDKGYMFISHSHKDIEKVRVIRNIFEQNGFEPILFYLKCLNDNDEIEDLIKREIKARNLFLYVDSENARNSNWVKTELEFIKTLDDKVIYNVDINQTNLDDYILNIIRHNVIFFSFSMKDSSLAEAIIKRLNDNDFCVLNKFDVIFSYDFSVKDPINTAIQYGYYVTLITKNVFNCMFLFDELKYAFSRNAKPIIIYTDDVNINDISLIDTMHISSIKIHAKPTENELKELIIKFKMIK